jgi:hypothetical protein
MFIAPQWMRGPNQEQVRDERVPRRVALAMEVVRQLNEKQMTKIAVTESSAQDFEGDKLELEEKRVYIKAWDTLYEYLDGNLKPTQAEKIDLELRKRDGDQGCMTIIRCPMCGGSSSVRGKPCDLCEGTGALASRPAQPE